MKPKMNTDFFDMIKSNDFIMDGYEEQNEENNELLFAEAVRLDDEIYAEFQEDLCLLPGEERQQSDPIHTRIPSLFINDILSSETVNISDDKTCLKFKNLRYINAMVRGIVVDVTLNEFKTTILVDDSTGVIPCIVESETTAELDHMREDVIKPEDATDQNESDDILLFNVSELIKDTILERMKCLPNYLGFKVGDMVQLFGKIKGCKNTKICYVDNIMKIPSIDVKSSSDFIKSIEDFHDALELMEDELF